MDAIVLIVGFAIVWAFGIVLLAALAPAEGINVARPGQISWMVGCGWFVGAFLLTLWMRLLALVHVPFGLTSIGLPLLASGGVLAWLSRIDTAEWKPWFASVAGRSLHGWRRAIWVIVVAWLSVRFALLLGEIVWRPLYPWDAWTQWATKARVWFELRTMVPFVTGSDWLQATNPNVYFDAGPLHPGTVPLLQVWSAILLGHWEDTLINLPWWITGVAFTFAVYGYLARRGLGAATAILGTWLVVSMPILEIHIALAGYADLAMATYLTLAALWTLDVVHTRRAGDVLVAVLLLFACVIIKDPGKVWVATLVPGVVIAIMPRQGVRVAIGLFVTAIGAMVFLASSQATILGYHLHLDFIMPWRALFDAYFSYGNWNLLWYGATAVALIARKQLLSPEVAPFTAIVAAGSAFLFFGFAFTNAGTWVEDQSTVNRATLHLAPLAAIWMILSFRAWSRRAEPKPTAPSRLEQNGIAA